jgi:hypothetical protein
MAIRLAKKGNKHRPKPAYLPMFAMMNPRAYAAWNSAPDKRQIRRTSFR